MAIGIKQRWKNLTREQQLALGVLSICGVAIMGLSALAMNARIQAPFYVPNQAFQKTQQILAKLNEEDTKVEASKSKDTDRDGLTDYQELNVYHTSPYLPDTDSDGAPDAVEIARGTNPGCPEGKPCAPSLDVVIKPSTSTSGFDDYLQTTKIPFAPAEALLGGTSSTQGAQDFLTSAPDPSTMSPGQMRTYLIERSLVTQDQVDSLSDTDMKRVYQSAYNEALRARAIMEKTKNASSNPTP